eukprot:1700080-Pleurochrysis_carterae.AAC.1
MLQLRPAQQSQHVPGKEYAGADATPSLDRTLSLPKAVSAKGGIDAWNTDPKLKNLYKTMAGSCTATTVSEALDELHAFLSLGHELWAYMYLRYLFNKDLQLCARSGSHPLQLLGTPE